MKLNKWLYGATALAMLAACSDKDIAPDSGGGTNEDGSRYIGIRIQLPTNPSTRADDDEIYGNDNFDDGEASEYALNTASLILFRCDDGTSAANDIPQNAKCIGAYDLRRSKDAADKDPSGQITTQVTRFANVTGMSKNEDLKLYALVMANGLDYNLNPAQITKDFPGKTIKDFQETFSTELLYNQTERGKGYASRIFMSNSPLSEYQGGAHNPNASTTEGDAYLDAIPVLPVLVEIDKTTYPTEQQAIDKPAGIIHIERAVGKVTCSSFTKATGVKVKIGEKDYTLEVDEIYWDLCQDMEKTYLVRNTNRTPIKDLSANPDSSTPEANMWTWNLAADQISSNIEEPAGKYRMLGHTPISARGKTYYRPYFCQVPGYGLQKAGDAYDNFEDKTFRNSKRAVKTGGNVYYMEPEDAVEWDAKSAFYPHENTFPVKYMKYANTTRIGFWVTFKFKDATGEELDMIDFYVRGLDRSTIYTENPLEGIAGNYLKEKDKIKTAVTEAMKRTEGVGGYDDLDLSDLIKFDWNDADDGDGQVMITAISWKDTDELPENYQEMFDSKPNYTFTAQDIAALNNLETVYKYKEGKVFYEVRIKHFGDDLTPWDPDKHAVASNIEESYGKTLAERKRNYLGRYGIVRNNWYDLQVSTIKRLGPPVDPAKWDDSWPGKPDDNKDEYIAVELRVLSWAKRTQNVEF